MTGRRCVAAWVLAIAVVAALTLSASSPIALSGGGERNGAEESHSYGAERGGDELVRQCLPESAPCPEIPAAAAAAVLSLEGDVIAAVANLDWHRNSEPAPLESRTVSRPPGTGPPRNS